MKPKTSGSGMLPSLLESELIVLYALADEGPTNMYQIMKKTGKAYSLVFKAFKTLQYRPMIALIEKKKTVKGTEANLYGLTFIGFLAILKRELSEDTKRWNENQFRKFMKNNEDWLPLVLSKWSFFQEAGVENLATIRLKAIVDRLNVENIHHLDSFGYGGSLVPACDIKSLVTWLFYFIGIIPVEGKFERNYTIRDDRGVWLEAVKKDPEIVAYLQEELDFYRQALVGLGELGERIRIKLIPNEDTSRFIP